MVYTVDMVYTVEIVYTVDIVGTVDTGGTVDTVDTVNTEEFVSWMDGTDGSYPLDCYDCQEYSSCSKCWAFGA